MASIDIVVHQNGDFLDPLFDLHILGENAAIAVVFIFRQAHLDYPAVFARTRNKAGFPGQVLVNRQSPAFRYLVISSVLDGSTSSLAAKAGAATAKARTAQACLIFLMGEVTC
ncbi:hypothetical protein ACFFUT_03600 [Pseudohalocynthiibacter aestuariivivens]|uniref:Uncharacterized protein n=1 Tax=Pseudohalocynthiibacter aestuariivivens TaxID=1591409 RepID=A0ABV5JBN9_9RHOB|nr:hypothetical protein [Pseudohalocynthiibacter aestuariivivens]MBS9718841.1 hypothetical protein [Pseudohalocynthiibacter aestuariivivens]